MKLIYIENSLRSGSVGLYSVPINSYYELAMLLNMSNYLEPHLRVQ